MSTPIEPTEHSERRVINLKAVAILVGIIVVGTICSRQLHARQVLHTRNYLKQAAETALQDGQHIKAMDLFEQYLRMNSNDDEVEEKISKILEDEVGSKKALERAFDINERLIGQDKDRTDLRMRQISIADRLGRYSDATVHLEVMKKQSPDNSNVWYFSGLVARDTANFDEAIQCFTKAVNLPDARPDAFKELAQLKLDVQEDSQAANSLLTEMVQQNPDSETRMIRAEWLLKEQNPEVAVNELWQTLQEKPDDARCCALLLNAIRKTQTLNAKFDADGETRKLINHLNDRLLQNPDMPEQRTYLSAALWSTGQRGSAIRNIRYGITRDPRQFHMYQILVDYLISERRTEEAQQAFDKIPVSALPRESYEFMRGRLLMAQEQWAPAIEAFELAIGFSSKNPSLAARCRVCVALCRRESGDNEAALQAYSSLIQSNPDFEGGRLGIASAYLRADQTQLAIAEYKQLLHVEGVAPFLANLIIKYNLTLPPIQRNWSDVEDLLRNHDNPPVSDAVQRALLKADLLFAQGFTSQAMDHLDASARQMPHSEEMARARKRMSNIHGDKLTARVLKVLKENPRNKEGHVALVRLFAAREDQGGLSNWISEVATGEKFPGLSETDRLSLLAEALTEVADAELLTRGSSDILNTLRVNGTAAWRQLAGRRRSALKPYVAFVARHQSPDAAIKVAEWCKANAPIGLQAECWLECLQAGKTNSTIQQRVSSEIAALIRKQPSDMDLRLDYAQARILTGQYQSAETLLNQIVQYDKSNARALSKLAWLSLLVGNAPGRALAYTERAALRQSNGVEVRQIRALALAENQRANDAMAVLNAIPRDSRTTSTRLIEARTLQRSGQAASAAPLVRELSLPRLAAQLPAPERQLLIRMRKELQLEAN